MARKANILVVDDNKINQEICKIYLEQENYSVFLAEDGWQGLKSATQIKPDLILLDIVMPVMDGYQMLEKLKSDPALADIPVLVLAVITDMNDMVKAFRLGANDCLKKPFNVDEFLARVTALIKHKKIQDVIKKYTKDLRQRQKVFEFELNKWAKEAEIFQQQFDTTLVDVADKSNTGGDMEQMLIAARKAKNLMNRIISMSRRENYQQLSA